MKLILTLAISVLLLVGCNLNQNQPLEGQPISENPILPLSTMNNNADPTEAPLDVPSLEEEGSKANRNKDNE